MTAGRDPAAAVIVADRRRTGLAALLAVWGPGLLVMLADTDVGNILTAAQSGTRWGYRLLPLPLLLIPLLYMVQELAARLGLHCGRGFAALVRGRLGRSWAWVAVAALAVATLGSLVTEFTGIAGIGEMVGASRALVLPLAAGCLLLVIVSRRYRLVERLAIGIGLFELCFFAIAWTAHPQLVVVGHDIADQRFADHGYLYLGAALIGATFNPWMIFYQTSALAEKRLGPGHHVAARWDTALGAVLTQLVTATVLVAAAATIAAGHAGAALDSVGQISEAMTPLLGETLGRLVFGMGVVGAAIVAAIVCSLALLWSFSEVIGHSGIGATAFYAACVLGAAGLVLAVPDLVWLSIATQVVNAMLLPLVAALLVVLASTVLPEAVRLRGWYLWVVTATVALVSAIGLVGAWAGMA